MNPTLKAVAHALSPSGARARLLVLIYHRVLAKPDPLLGDEPDAVLFAAQMDLIKSLFNVLPLAEAVARLRAGSLPPRAACITFDDGYANNCEVAAPILAARNLPATVFVSSGFIGGGRMWNDTIIETVRGAPVELDLSRFGLGTFRLDDTAARRTAIERIIAGVKYLHPVARLERVEQIAAHVGARLPDQLMMNEAQLKSLSGMAIEIGAHTVSHPVLTSLSDEESRTEMLSSKRHLEEIAGVSVTTFAYPNGRPLRDYESRHVKLARECGFTCSVSTAWGAARREHDSFQIPRIAPWDKTATRFAVRMIKSYVDPVAQVA
jgi:peptidoglycan/xylan/chitin deacetylase (PgdA/CDA1 family)